MGNVFDWLTTSANWHGDGSIPQRLAEHLQYSAVAVLIAAVIAIPFGLWIGHTGRGRFVVVNAAGVMRAIPSLGLLYVGFLILSPHVGMGATFLYGKGEGSFYIPSEIVLIVLAIPPILAGTYSGVDEVDAGARDAAKGMGMGGMRVLMSVEFPCALPLIFSGLRSAVLQVVATATIAAVLGMGGLGRFIIDGLSVRDYGQMASGALLVTLLALSVDLVFAVIQRFVVSPGLTGRIRVARKAADVALESSIQAPA